MVLRQYYTYTLKILIIFHQILWNNTNKLYPQQNFDTVNKKTHTSKTRVCANASIPEYYLQENQDIFQYFKIFGFFDLYSKMYFFVLIVLDFFSFQSNYNEEFSFFIV